MKIAVLSDIHGNWQAFKAIVAAVDAERPDLVVVGGDIVGGGGRLADIIDAIYDRGWPCISGNTDEMLWQPERIDALAGRLPQMSRMWDIIRDDIRIARTAIGAGRLKWLRELPDRWLTPQVAVVHASPGDKWNSPPADASDDALTGAYAGLDRPVVVYGHLHVPFVRRIGALTVANSGAVGLPNDGDPRAAYLVIDGTELATRRVAYDVELEIADRARSGYPHASWIGQILRTGTFVPP
jgi:predicted phosphodiesterase